MKRSVGFLREIVTFSMFFRPKICFCHPLEKFADAHEVWEPRVNRTEAHAVLELFVDWEELDLVTTISNFKVYSMGFGVTRCCHSAHT